MQKNWYVKKKEFISKQYIFNKEGVNGIKNKTKNRVVMRKGAWFVVDDCVGKMK